MTPVLQFSVIFLQVCACACTTPAVFQLLLSDPPSNLPPYHIYSTLLLTVYPSLSLGHNYKRNLLKRCQK